MKNKIKIGVMADDFTGASDAASFLTKSGLNTLMFTTIPESLDYPCDAIVIALKSRSVSPQKALLMVEEATDFLLKNNCEKLYFKYCSTFDSTPSGNIGVVMDFLMDTLDLQYSVLCPSLPVNGRTVRDGILYVNDIPLSESSMKNHPLNPMWDSSIPILMKDQSRYPSFVLREDTSIEDLMKEHNKFYLVPDYVTDEDGAFLGEKFKDLKLLSGGSALLEHLFKGDVSTSDDSVFIPNKSLIVCGSCSKMTLKQINTFRMMGGITYAVESSKLLDTSLSVSDVLEYIQGENNPVLVYSSAIEQDMHKLKNSPTFTQESLLMENFLAELSLRAVEVGYNNIVVGGGETSGAVTLRLGFDGFYIGEVIDPGIPALYPLTNQKIRLVLKSGNFGAEDFFVKAVREV